jgi:hypothetical protein
MIVDDEETQLEIIEETCSSSGCGRNRSILDLVKKFLPRSS